MNDEFISRESAIEAFDDPRVERNYGDVSPESVIRVIESIPAADVRPVVRGKYEETWVRALFGTKVCSHCKCRVPVGNFCYMCGAEMMEGENE